LPRSTPFQRAFGMIYVCIGEAKVKCGTQLSADTANPKLIRGKVFVSKCRDPG